MDAQGFLPISLIAGFHRVQALTMDITLIMEVPTPALASTATSESRLESLRPERVHAVAYSIVRRRFPLLSRL